MLQLEDFPTLNASLNATTALLLTTGWLLVRRRRLLLHKICMLSAATTGLLFLACYLYYHAHVGTTRFPGQGWARPVYFSVLISHTLLAAAVLPLALVTLYRGLKNLHPKHERLARWTLPIWLYVSVTGVVVYWMLYRVSW